MAIVYIATHKENGTQYVGCTTGGLLNRRNNHAVEARRGKSGKFMDAIREDGIDAFDWSIYSEHENHDIALDVERELVLALDTRDHGYNTQCGGYRTGGRSRTDEERVVLRQRAHEWQARQPDFGKEQSRKLSEFYKTDAGRKQLAMRKETANRLDTRLAMSKSHGGKPVNVFKDGVFIKQYATQGECSRELELSQGNLNSCLHRRNGATMLRGYTFEFAT